MVHFSKVSFRKKDKSLFEWRNYVTYGKKTL